MRQVPRLILTLPFLLLALTPGAGAEVASGSYPGQLGPFERGLLGTQHAEEHAMGREQIREQRRRWRRLSRRQRRERTRARRQAAVRFARATRASGPADRIGRWTHAPFELPHAAVHAALLPTGKILFWGVPFPDEPVNAGHGALWDPSRGYGPGAFTEVPPPVIDPDGAGPQGPGAAPLICSGMSLLPSGEVLVVGGNMIWPFQYPDDAYESDVGLNRVYTFDPWSESWAEQPEMEAGRWYPGQELLPDGRSIILGGYTEAPPGGVVGDDLEVFTPADEIGGAGSITHESSADRVTDLYPHLFTLPDSRVLLAGPRPVDTAALSTGDFTWADIPDASMRRIGGAAVQEPAGAFGSWRVTQIGGFGPEDPETPGFRPATETSETFDARKPGDGWRSGPDLNLARSQANAVLLPDRSMVALGGGIGFTQVDGKYAIDSDGARRQVEAYDPKTRRWRLGPAQLEDRGYHSTAVLLPDGRVWSAGDNRRPYELDGSNALSDSAEIYSPPYLFQGARPGLKRAPRKLRWGDVFGVRTKRKPQAQRAVLMAPGTTTHADDTNQRLIPLRLRRRHQRRGLDLVSPPTRAVAPPGYYMLFVLRRGIPSRARWVQLSPDAPNAPNFKHLGR